MFIVVMGRQADVRKKLVACQVPDRHTVELVGFCKEMPKLLAVADLMVGKCGGLTAAENAAMGVPLIILDPIPGQEQRNADALLEAGAALKCNDLPLLTSKLDGVFEQEKLDRMTEGVGSFAKSKSSFTVADELLYADQSEWKE